MNELTPEGFYTIQINGNSAVGYCEHMSDQSFPPYEQWTCVVKRANGTTMRRVYRGGRVRCPLEFDVLAPINF